MGKIQTQDAKRYKVDNPGVGSSYYIVISETAIQAFAPNESAPDNAEEYSLINALCRVSSKARGRGMTWGAIACQIKSAGVGFKTTTDKIAKCISMFLEYQAKKDGIDFDFDWEQEPQAEDEMIGWDDLDIDDSDYDDYGWEEDEYGEAV